MVGGWWAAEETAALIRGSGKQETKRADRCSITFIDTTAAHQHYFRAE